MRRLVVTTIICLCLFGSASGHHGNRGESARETRDAKERDRHDAWDRFKEAPSRENLDRVKATDRAVRGGTDFMPDVDRSKLAGSKEVDRSAKWDRDRR